MIFNRKMLSFIDNASKLYLYKQEKKSNDIEENLK